MRALALSLILALSSGCGTIRVYQSEAAENAPGGVFVEKYSMTVWGLNDGSPPVNLSQRCKHGWVRLSSWVSTSQALLRVVTLNFYSPWTIEVVCAPMKLKPPEDLGPEE